MSILSFFSVKYRVNSVFCFIQTREDVFTTQEYQNELLYALKDTSLEKVGPYNENMKLIGSNRLNDAKLVTSQGFDATVQNGNSNNGISANSTAQLSTTTTHSHSSITNVSSRRGAKRKASDTSGHMAGNSTSNNNRRKGINDISRLEKMVPTCFPNEHPFNKDGYRYHLVEPDPHSPLRQKFEETEFWAGKPLPGHLYRLFIENKVLLAMHDRAPQLKLSEDRLTITGDKGYSMIRSTHGVAHGAWFFEAIITDKPSNSATRIGWAQKLANLQAPVGFDKFSYSWRSRKGTCFHSSIGRSNSKGGYDVGDTLGFYIYFPEPDDKSKLLYSSHKNMVSMIFAFNNKYYLFTNKYS